MLILGLDPGLAITGYGIIAPRQGKFEAVTYGCIKTEAGEAPAKRLLLLFDELSALIARHAPDVAAIEQLFFNRNVTSALAVGQGRGAALVCLAKHGLPVSEYTPLQVKLTLTGYGRAEKAQVGYMVRSMLGLPAVPKPDDVADALAVALCHAHHAASRLSRLLEGAKSD